MAETAIDFSLSYDDWIAGDGAAIDEFTIDMSGVGDPDPWTWANLNNSLLKNIYPRMRGAALGSWVRAANSEGALTYVQAASDGHVLRRNGATLGYGVLAAGAFPTAPGIVSLAMLDNGSACSVPGRSANSSGARADITIAEGQYLGRRSNVVGSYAVDLGDIADDVVLDLDFSALANNTLADGTESINGVNWTVANTAASNTFEILGGTGLRFNAHTTNTAYTTASRTAAYLRVALSSLIPSWDVNATYLIEIWISSATTTTNNRIQIFIDNDNAGTDSMYAGGRRDTGPDNTWCGIDGLSSILGVDATHTAVGIRVNASGVSGCGGTYSSGFPSPYQVAAGFAPRTAVSNHPMDASAFLGIAFVTGETGGNMDITIPRLRVTRIRG